MMAGIVRSLIHICKLIFKLIYCLEGLFWLGRPALGWTRFYELKRRAICSIEDSRFGKDFFGKFLTAMFVCMLS